MNLLDSFSNLCGWITVWLFAATVMNYVAKVFGMITRKLKSNVVKTISTLLKRIFVRYHRLFGVLCMIFLLMHLILKYARVGISVSGAIVGCLFVIQVLLGIYSKVKKKPRKGMWFWLHRIIAFLIIIGIGVHLIFPAVLYKDNSINGIETTVTGKASFTISELAKCNGKNGQPAYVAYKGIVYDVSDVPKWKGGSHNGVLAGTDITNLISNAPHGTSVLSGLPIVGTLKE